MRRLIFLLAGFVLVRGLLRRRAASRRMDLYDKVAIVTGSSRGLGLVLAEELAFHGARVVLCARSPEELEAARERIARTGAEVLSAVCDVGNREHVQRLIDSTAERWGRVDILINNAGIITVGPIADQSIEDFEETMATHFWGIVHTTLGVLPQMRERGAGEIVNITSIGGRVSVPHLLPYNSSKFAAVGFSEGLHAEVARHGVNVLTVVPGLMRTGSHVNAFFKGNNRAEFSWFSLGASLPFTSIDARSAARQIIDAMRRREAELIITPQAQMMARFYGLFPGVGTRLTALVNMMLPRPTGEKRRVLGRESETALSQSLLTVLGRNAAHEYQDVAQSNRGNGAGTAGREAQAGSE